MFLKDFNLFESCNNEELKKHAIERVYYPGEIIFQEDEICKEIILILEGKVSISTYNYDGDEFIIKNSFPGDIIGSLLIFSDKNIYYGTGIAKEKTKTLIIKKSNLLYLFNRFSCMYLNFIKYLSNTGIEINNKLKVMTQKSIREKILFYLKINEDQNGVVTLTMNKEELAKYLSIPRPSLSRELINMQKDNLIIVNGKTIKKVSKY